ncbi:MAG TPA: hypothetical protein VGL75_10020 [Acidothermaceae bacterium]|jgi:hypothetical protein
MGVVRILALIGGFAILAGTTSSVLRTFVVPRGVLSRVSDMVLDATVRVCRMVADKFAEYERRDNILAWAAPLSLMTLLFTWIASFWIGYSLLDFGFTHFSVGMAMRQAGSSIATLGFAASPSGSLTILDIAASITGMVVVALQIAYLPTLYAAYNRRESLITVLSARGGEPAWGPEILARHVWLNLEGNLPELYSNWENWAATVSESHTSYPVLIHFRSPQPLRSWLIALLGVMDAAALQTALAPTTAPVEARLLLQMGYLTLRDLAAIESIPTRHDPSPDDPIRLPYEEFAEAVEMLSTVGLPTERTAAQAWPHFRGWRVNYEDAAYGLARHIDAVPARWSGTRRREDQPIPPVRPVNRQPTTTDLSVSGELAEESQ